MSSLKEQFDAIDLAGIERFVKDREQEHLHLDFKTFEDRTRVTRNQRKELAKVISGFANSSGGILVWGVVAKRDEDGVDAAIDLQPIENLSRAYGEFQSYTGPATDPAVDGVEHKKIVQAGTTGFLVTYVPESDRTPHMAKLGEDRYWKRSGDSFYKVEHFDLEDMFGRRPKPKLSLYTKMEGFGYTSGPSGTTHRVGIVLGIYNAGRGTARFPCLSVQLRAELYTLHRSTSSVNLGLPVVAPVSAADTWVTFAGGADSVIHPDTVLQVTQIDIYLQLQSVPEDLRFVYRLGAEGLPRFEDELSVPGRDFADLVSQNAAAQAL